MLYTMVPPYLVQVVEFIRICRPAKNSHAIRLLDVGAGCRWHYMFFENLNSSSKQKASSSSKNLLEEEEEEPPYTPTTTTQTQILISWLTSLLIPGQIY